MRPENLRRAMLAAAAVADGQTLDGYDLGHTAEIQYGEDVDTALEFMADGKHHSQFAYALSLGHAGKTIPGPLNPITIDQVAAQFAKVDGITWGLGDEDDMDALKAEVEKLRGENAALTLRLCDWANRIHDEDDK